MSVSMGVSSFVGFVLAKLYIHIHMCNNKKNYVHNVKQKQNNVTTENGTDDDNDDDRKKNISEEKRNKMKNLIEFTPIFQTFKKEGT